MIQVLAWILLFHSAKTQVISGKEGEREICWTQGYLGYILQGSVNGSKRWNSLEEAKSFCEQRSDCGGITYAYLKNICAYEARGGTTLQPIPPYFPILEKSFLKIPCDHNHPQMLNPGKTYITPDFYTPDFKCDSLKVPPQKIERIWIWGERNSGTGMLQQLMNSNFQLKEKAIGGLPWKHGFMSQQRLEDMGKTLNIFVVKDAYGWLNSMRKNPHHANPFFRNVLWSSFLTHEWSSEMVKGDEGEKEEIDLNPATGSRFRNILQLRAAKLRDWVKVRECLPYHITVRYEDVIRNVSQVIYDIAQQFQPCGLQLKSGAPYEYVCVISDGNCVDYEQSLVTSKRDYYLDRAYLAEISSSVLPFIANNLDYRIEELVGYKYPAENNFDYRKRNTYTMVTS